ncbi:LysE family transporter [Microbacterium sp. ZW T5_56]|uniref:LysE family transporter n=1 Tax=Microbacterium sp. ZW T5_56 TaxID=3378081 RepID=UPI0038551A9B
MINEVWGAAGAGAMAGLGVAMPLGAIGAMLLREALVHGRRRGVAAALGIATTDVIYCAVATATGTLLAGLIESFRAGFLLASGLLVVLIGLRQLRGSITTRSAHSAEATAPSAGSAYLRFAGLTALNPMTLVYFIALGGAVSAPTGSPAAPIAFVVSAGIASLGWQLLLVATGSLFRRAAGERTARVIGVVASALVLLLGVGVVASGITALVSGA